MTGVDDDAATKSKPGRILKILRLLFGFAITALCLLYIFKATDFSQIAAAVKEFKWQYGLLSLACLAIGYCLRILRWSAMLRVYNPEINAARCAQPYLASIALNNLLPFRAGDAIRAFVFPKLMAIRRSDSVATLIFERAMDLVLLAALLAIGVSAIDKEVAPSWVLSGIQLIFVLVIFLALFAIIGNRIVLGFVKNARRLEILKSAPVADKTLSFVEEVIEYIALLLRGSTFGGVLLLTIGVWVFEASVFASVMAGLGDEVSVTGVALISGMATIATLAPSSPGYFGPFHLAAFESYKMLFGEPGRAAAMAVLSHAAIWMPTTIAGLVALLVGLRAVSYRGLSV